MTKYKVGDKVRIVGEQVTGMNLSGKMDKYLGSIMTIKSCDGALKPYKMEEDQDFKDIDFNGWCWDDNMIERLVTEEVELHPDFKEWYEGIYEHWNWKSANSHKEFAIFAINQIGFEKGLINHFNKDVGRVMGDLAKEMKKNKEKYTRAILDDNWTIREEPKYYVKFESFKEKCGYLNLIFYNGKTEISTRKETSLLKTKFTEKEIKEIDERYWAFAVPVNEEEK